MSKPKTLCRLHHLSLEDTLAEQNEPGVGVVAKHEGGDLEPQQWPLFRIKPEDAADQRCAFRDPQPASDRAGSSVVNRPHVETIVNNLYAVRRQSEPFGIALRAGSAVV